MFIEILLFVVEPDSAKQLLLAPVVDEVGFGPEELGQICFSSA